MRLERPSIAYKESFIAAVREYQEQSTGRVPDYARAPISGLEEHFDAYVERELSKEAGENLPAGWVPQTTLWLIDEGRYVGRVSIRHRLTESLLRIGGHIGYDIRPSMRRKGYGTRILSLALPHARQLGITRVLVTCDSDNVASRRIIEKNGGIPDETALDDGEQKLRFWIENTGIQAQDWISAGEA